MTAGTLADFNVILDVVTRDQAWGSWSRQALADAAEQGRWWSIH